MTQEEIDKQTALIKELECSFPKRNPDADRWAEENRSYELHWIKIQDAYWKRRMMVAQLPEFSRIDHIMMSSGILF